MIKVFKHELNPEITLRHIPHPEKAGIGSIVNTSSFYYKIHRGPKYPEVNTRVR